MAYCSTVTAQSYKDFILFSLTLAEPCAIDYLNDVVLDAMWDSQRLFSGCDSELQYLLTRRDALRLLMFCTAQQVDNRHARSDSVATTDGKTRMDGRSSRQATNANSGRADSVFLQRFNAHNNAQADAEGTLRSQTIGHDRSKASMDDTGSGSSRTDTASSHYLRGLGYTIGNHSEYIITRTDGQGGGCVFDYSYDDEKSYGKAEGIGDSGGLFGASAGVAAVTGWSTSGGRSTSEHIQSDYSWNTLDKDGYGVSRTESRDDTVDNTNSSRSSSDYFHALRDESSNSQTQSDFESAEKDARDSKAHAEGQGSSETNTNSKESGASQSTAAAHEDSVARRESNSTSATVSDFIAAGQRFEHLKMLLANTEDSIRYLRMLLSSRARPATGLMQNCEPDGLCVWPYIRAALPTTTERCPQYIVVESEYGGTCLSPKKEVMTYQQACYTSYSQPYSSVLL